MVCTHLTLVPAYLQLTFLAMPEVGNILSGSRNRGWDQKYVNKKDGSGFASEAATGQGKCSAVQHWLALCFMFSGPR